MSKFLRYFAFVVICYAAFLASDQAQTATVIPANEAAAHLNEWEPWKALSPRFLPASPETLFSISVQLPEPNFYRLDTTRISSFEISHTAEHSKGST